jgi:peptidoglycan L-alanyl-D-glutamate endopeptidase CwlK
MLQLNPSSEAKLKRVHPDLVRVVRRLAKDWTDPDVGLVVTCGARTVEQQRVLVAKGASKTMRSRHLIAPNGYAHAVDFAVTIHGKLRWDWPLYARLAKAVKAAAAKEKVPVEWGGDWVSFKDGPHFQLPWAKYPGTK